MVNGGNGLAFFIIPRFRPAGQRDELAEAEGGGVQEMGGPVSWL